MANAKFRAAASASASGSVSTVTVNRPTGTVAGDLLIATMMQDRDNSTAQPGNMSAPAGSGWVLLGTRGSKTAGSFVHVWTKTAASNDPSSWAFNDHSTSGDACDLSAGIIALYDWNPSAVLTLAWLEDPADTPTYTAPGGAGVVDGLLVNGYHRGDSTGASATFSNPSGAQTIRTAQSPSGSWVSLAIATEPLTAAGATGTRTVTSSDSAPSIGWSIVVPPSAVAAAATMGGTGTLSAASTPLDEETVALSGRGTLTAGAARAVSGAMGGGGTLAATPTPRATQAVALSGSGVLAAGARLVGVAALSGLGTLTGLRGRMARHTGAGTLTAWISFRFAPLTWPVDGSFDGDGVTTGAFTTDGISAGAFDSDGIGDGHFAY